MKRLVFIILLLLGSRCFADTPNLPGLEIHQIKNEYFIADIANYWGGIVSYKLTNQQFYQKEKTYKNLKTVPPPEKTKEGLMDMVSTWDVHCCLPFASFFEEVQGKARVVRLRKMDNTNTKIEGDFLTVYQSDPIFTIVKKEDDEVVMVWPDPNQDKSDLFIERRYKINGTYSLDATIRILNLGDERVFVKPVIAMRAWEPPPEKPGFCGGIFSGPVDTLNAVGYSDGSLSKVSHTDLHPDRECPNPRIRYCSEMKACAEGRVDFAGIDKRYFLMAVIPTPQNPALCRVFAHDSGMMETQIYWDKMDIPPVRDACRPWYLKQEGFSLCPEENVTPRNSREIKFTAYVGPKDLDILEGVGSGLDKTIDFWILGFICKPMLWLMKFFHDIIPSWGVSIILLTIVVKLLTLYWSQKSIVQMRKLQALKPKIDALRERYKDDKVRLNQAMMELYKREKVNPFGGCLPMLLQMPIWIALYRTIYSAVELYQAPLFLWIDDLSAPDPYYVTPLLLGVAMFLQQRMSPTTGDPTQAKMMQYLMPIIFTLFMLPLPSGLVFYIFVNTLLSIAHQLYLNHRLAASGG